MIDATELSLAGCFLLKSEMLGDSRGHFAEVYRAEEFAALGIDHPFVQDNRSRSEGGVLRGLHYQRRSTQGHLVQVLSGAIFDVGVDLRHHSPTFGQWVGVDLAAETGESVYLAPGVAHGFFVTGTHALLYYKCTAYYSHEDERGILWSDPDLSISWPSANPQVVERDCAFPLLRDVPKTDLPKLGAG